MATFDKLLRRCAAANKELRNDQAIDHLWLGTMLVQQKDFAAARTEIAASIDILKGLADEDSSNASWTHNLAIAHYEFGELMVAQRDFAGGAEEFRRQPADSAALSDREPQKVGYRSELFYAISSSVWRATTGRPRRRAHRPDGGGSAGGATQGRYQRRARVSRPQNGSLGITRNEIAARHNSQALPADGAAKSQ